MKEDKVLTSSWIKGALYLSIATFIVKALSALYKVPYQNMTGDVGYYVYQQVYPLYGIVFVLGTYGYPLVLSKMLAEDNEKGSFDDRQGRMDRMIVLFLFMLIFNGIAGILFIVFATPIALLMGDVQLSQPIRWLGLPFFLIPFLALGRGYFQSTKNMLPTAFSQVSEQMVRIIAILLIAAWAMGKNDPYLAGTSAGIGALLGSLFGIIVMLLFWRKEYNRRGNKLSIKNFKLPHHWIRDGKSFFISSFLVSVSAMALIIFQFIDSFSIYRLLIYGGIRSEEAAVLKGIYDRGWPMIQLGATVTTVFSYALIPYMVKAYAGNEKSKLQEYVSQSIKVCLVFGGAASIGLIAIMKYLNPMLFTDQSGTLALQMLASTVLSGALFMTVAALLHSVGKARYSVFLLVIGLGIKVLGNVVSIPRFGIEGAAFSSSFSFLIMAVISLVLLYKWNLIKHIHGLFYGKWILSLVGLVVSVWLIQQGMLMILQFEQRMIDTIVAFGGAMLGAFIFLVIIWKLKLFTKSEWESLPKISKLLPYKS
ncbi:polysaccharide biosynthesis protein [Evansella sp. AB-P1]|uniref:putative polysaccharide biosynthesis protein n=1 Tax=Evansella sp. AB-P1 TaxID=3037653 RepID=UPI00241C183F|nr:polysaccharide biosynthesis protein [Evansella sp. AB-P1]MDG5789987.1 polysaccharide biosynthesis protein [Evansella sp. AB-P1]